MWSWMKAVGPATRVRRSCRRHLGMELRNSADLALLSGSSWSISWNSDRRASRTAE